MLNRRRFLTFSVRSLYTATAISGLGFAVIRKRVRFANDQRAIVERIQDLGGTVGYEHEWDYASDRFSGKPVPGSALIRAIVGNHFYLKPDIVMLDDFDGVFRDFPSFDELKGLQHLSLCGCPNVDDRIIERINRLPNLKCLLLNGTPISANALSELSKLETLETLYVSADGLDATDVDRLTSIFPDGVFSCADEPYESASEWIVRITTELASGT